MMSVIAKLSSSLNQRDELPNIKLAKELAGTNNKKGIHELIKHLADKNKRIQNDCIKVLYEIGALNPALISGFADTFIDLLSSKNNRLQWGAMTALGTITNENPKAVAGSLTKIIAVADKGSVITNDQCVVILIKLCAMKEYEKLAFPLLNERFLVSPTNQLPMYAEQALLVIPEKNKTLVIKTLSSRLTEIEKDTKRIRVEKVIKKLQG